MRHSFVFALLLAVAFPSVAFAQLLDVQLPSVQVPVVAQSKSKAPMQDYDENLMGANKKMLFDATMTHYMNLLKQSEVAVSNAVSLSNRQNNDAQFTSHLAQLRTLNAGLLAGANVGSSQNRQWTGADVAMSQAYQNSTYVNQVASLIYSKLADSLLPVIVEALRNPPAGMVTTGRPPVNQSGE